MPPTAVHQLVPSLSEEDGPGALARSWQAALRGWGFDSEIFAARHDGSARGQARPGAELLTVPTARTVLLIHLGLEAGPLAALARGPGRKVVVYHGLPPDDCLEPHEPQLARASRAAREELYELAGLAERGYAFTRFSAEELSAAGFAEVATVPPPINWSTLDAEQDPALMAELNDGFRNVLFVGPMAPYSRIDDLLRTFAAYQKHHNPRSRLVLAGGPWPGGAYGAHLAALQAQLGLERVRFLGSVTASQRATCFRTAHLFLSLGQHESAGWALAEAMYWRLPIVAYGAPPIVDLLGGAGVTSAKRDPAEIAGMLANLDRRADSRSWVVARQHQRVQDLSREQLVVRIRAALAPVLDKTPLRALRPPPELPAVQLVCPGLDAAPEHPLSRAARSLAVSLGARCDVSLLALKAGGWPPGPAPELAREGMAAVLKFSPDLPLEEGQPLPRSASLEAAVRTSDAPVVYFGTGESLARALLPETAGRAFAVDESAESGSGEARRLGDGWFALAAPGGVEQGMAALAGRVLARLEQEDP